MRKAALMVSLLLVAAPLLAQPRVDLTAFVGYRWGGTIDAGADNVFGTDLSVADSGSYGAILGFSLNPNVQIELSASRQASELEASRGVFDPKTPLGEIDVTYYQIGATWGYGREVRPFAGMSLGAAVLDPDLPNTSSETRFAGTVFGGLKIRLSENLGVRLEGKMLWVALEDEDACYSCYYDGGGAGMLQGEVAVGLIIYF
jgi:opacity protein-like surface antigen